MKKQVMLNAWFLFKQRYNTLSFATILKGEWAIAKRVKVYKPLRPIVLGKIDLDAVKQTAKLKIFESIKDGMPHYFVTNGETKAMMVSECKGMTVKQMKDQCSIWNDDIRAEYKLELLKTKFSK